MQIHGVSQISAPFGIPPRRNKFHTIKIDFPWKILSINDAYLILSRAIKPAKSQQSIHEEEEKLGEDTNTRNRSFLCSFVSLDLAGWLAARLPWPCLLQVVSRSAFPPSLSFSVRFVMSSPLPPTSNSSPLQSACSVRSYHFRWISCWAELKSLYLLHLSLPPCHPLRPTLTNQLQKHPSPFFPPGCESVPYRVKCTIRKTETHWPIRLLNGTGRQWKLIQKWLTRVVFITLDCFERKNQFENNYNHGFLTDNWTILLFYGI